MRTGLILLAVACAMFTLSSPVRADDAIDCIFTKHGVLVPIEIGPEEGGDCWGGSDAAPSGGNSWPPVTPECTPSNRETVPCRPVGLNPLSRRLSA
jgi:hypothetical protein